jgi:NAD(P)-dependent dehydrogenase (short-subunit alcohol dehydrogenase family)
MVLMKCSTLFSLEGKTAIVTGGAGILGKMFCNALAEQGANVAVVDLSGDEAFDFAQTLAEQYGVEALGIECDVSRVESVHVMVEKVFNKWRHIDILHNNAASKSSCLESFFQPFEEYDLSTWNEVMSVNVNGMFLVAQAVGRKMIEQKTRGSIIQTASIYGIMAPDNRIYENAQYMGCQINTPAVYAVSKAAVLGLTRYLAAYWAKQGIRVNSITPGGVESGQNQSFVDNYAKRVPMDRMAKRDEMVGALLYLASEASSYVTGQNIIVDGGLSIW